MKIQVLPGVVGKEIGVSWGHTPDGCSAMLVQGPGGSATIIFEGDECRDHGVTACWMAIQGALQAPAASPEPAKLRRATGLVGVDGQPILSLVRE